MHISTASTYLVYYYLHVNNIHRLGGEHQYLFNYLVKELRRRASISTIKQLLNFMVIICPTREILVYHTT